MSCMYANTQTGGIQNKLHRHLFGKTATVASKLLLSVCIIPPFLFPFEQTVWASTSISSHIVQTIPEKEKTDSELKMTNVRQTWQNFKQHKPKSFQLSPFTHLPVLSDGSAAMPSNANNFHGAFNSSVNPRTGMPAVSIKLASTYYDNGQAKRDLTLAYSGSSSPSGRDPLGLGPNWSLNIGTEHPSSSEVAGHQTTDLTIGDGHGFTMESDRTSKGKVFWHPLRHKLKDVIITGTPGDWTIATFSGTREHLLYGYEDWEEGRDGQRVWFYYDRHGPMDMTRRLRYVCAHVLTEQQLNLPTNACQGDGLWLTYSYHDITVHGNQVIVIHTDTSAGDTQVNSISMPSLSSEKISNHTVDSHILFSYDNQGSRPWLINTVTGPTGQKSTFLYNGESTHDGLQPHGLPTGFLHANLPVVKEQLITPAPSYKDQIPVRHLWYQYSKGVSDEHNFTGYQSGVNAEPGKDNLLDRSDDYTYTVTQDDGLSTTTTTYNKYHLPLTVTQTDDLHHSPILSNNVVYAPWKNTTFAQLPATFSLPEQTVNSMYSLTGKGQDPSIDPIKVLQQKRYNNNGQVIWQQDNYGRQMFFQYCPPAGDAHCPKMDPDWPQGALPEKIIEVPASKSLTKTAQYLNITPTNDPAPVVETVFNYQLIPVARIYHKKVNHYRQLLQKQWKKSQQKKINKYSLSASEVFSQQRFNHTVGEDNSPLAGSWQVSSKSTGSLSLNSVTDLKPGSALPELSPNEIFTKTDYQYDINQNSKVFGQLTHISVTNYNRPDPLNNRKTLKAGSGEWLHEVPSQQEHSSFTVTHHIDTQLHTRTTDVEVDHATPAIDAHRRISELLKTASPQSANGNLSLGQSVYSISSGVKLSSYDTLKTLHVTWTYDSWMRPVKELIIPVRGGHPKTITWSYIVTDTEQAVVKTAPDGTQEKMVYTSNGKHQLILSAWHRSKEMTTAPLEGASNWIPDKSVTYTQERKPATTVIFHADDHGNPVGLTTTYGYDSLNRNVWKKLPDGLINFTVRNDPQLLLISYKVATGINNQGEQLAPMLRVVQSNTLGKPVAQYIFSMNPAITIKSRPVYSDALKLQLTSLENQLKPVSYLTTEQNYGLLPLSGENGLFSFVNQAIRAGAWLSKTATIYDGNGRTIEQTQPNGTKIQWKWRYNNLAATIAPNGSLIHDTFNIQGKKIARCVKPAGQPDCRILGTRGYNEDGTLAWKQDNSGNKITYTYDADGRLLSKNIPATKTGKGHIFTYTYNSFARTQASLDGEVYVTYQYDPDTWQLKDKEDAISHLHYDYNPNTSALIKVTRTAPVHFTSPHGIHYPAGTVTMTYNCYGQTVSMTNSAGYRFTAIHDLSGRVVEADVTLPEQTTPVLLNATTYDVFFNRPIKIINGAGVERDFGYDSLGNLEKTTDKQGDKILQTLSYTYDPQTQNIITFTRSEGKNSATQTYSYDKNTNNLTAMSCSVTGKIGVASVLCPRDTDISGSNLTRPPIITTQHYSFDDWNNIKTVDEQLVTMNGKPTTKTTTYTYAQITADNKNIDPHRMVTFSTHWQDSVSNFSKAPDTITYDHFGRIVRDANGNTLHYNAFGQQDRFTNASTREHTVYTYDSTEHQVAEQTFDIQEHARQTPLYMVYLGNAISEQVQQDIQGNTHTSVELAGIAHSEDNHITRWYLHNYKGDVIASLNSAGQRISDHVYSPYGMDYDLLSSQEQALPQKLNLLSHQAFWKDHLPGFDEQMTDPVTGYQFLGGGYRAYNPVYRHFMSHDSYSPFTRINGYGFGDNNPIMKTDPSGHFPKWLGIMLGALTIGMAGISAMLFPVAFAALSASVPAGAAGAAAVFASMTMITPVMGLAGATQIAQISYPQNSGLATANNIISFISDMTQGILSGIMLFSGALMATMSTANCTASMIIGTSVSGLASAGDSFAGSVMSTALQLAPNERYRKIADIINGVNMGLLGVTMVMSAFTIAWIKVNIKNIVPSPEKNAYVVVKNIYGNKRWKAPDGTIQPEGFVPPPEHSALLDGQQSAPPLPYAAIMAEEKTDSLNEMPLTFDKNTTARINQTGDLEIGSGSEATQTFPVATKNTNAALLHQRLRILQSSSEQNVNTISRTDTQTYRVVDILNQDNWKNANPVKYSQ